MHILAMHAWSLISWCVLWTYYPGTYMLLGQVITAAYSVSRLRVRRGESSVRAETLSPVHAAAYCLLGGIQTEGDLRQDQAMLSVVYSEFA